MSAYSGEVSGAAGSDVRVPFGIEYPARLVAPYSQTAACPDSRHLWDALVAGGQGRETDPDDYSPDRHDRGDAALYEVGVTEVQAFRLVLTCVRCGVVERLAGVLHHGRSTGGGRRVHPVPLRAGDMAAQQVYAWDRWRRPEGDDEALTGDWTIHHAQSTTGTVIGRIAAQQGRRGAIRHVGRLNTWPKDVTVTAPTPAACLRKIARQATTTESDPTGTVTTGTDLGGGA